MHQLWRELRHAVRSLRQAPVFSVVVILTLGVGVGATATIFAVVNAVLLRPLPFAQPDRIISVSGTRGGVDAQVVSEPDLVAWRAGARTLQSIAGYSGTSGVLLDNGIPETLPGTSANAALFDVLRVAPILGRVFRPEEEKGEANRVVVISYELWQTRFGGDPQILTRKLALDTREYPILGVMPEGFDFPRRAQFWRPRAFDASTPNAVLYGQMIGRLAPGASLAHAQQELAALRPAEKYQAPGAPPSTLITMTLHDRRVGNAAKGLWFLQAAVLSLLLVACANVASLMLTRGTLRRREFAVRLALGAARRHLVRQLLTESVLLSLAGGLLGLLIPVWSLAALVRLSPASVANAQGIGVDPAVMAVSIGLSLLTGVVFAFFPMWQAMREDIARPLNESSARASASGSRQRFRMVLVAAEIAVALTLVTGGGLMLRSLQQVLARDAGFDPEGVTTASFFLSRNQYPDPASATRFFDEVSQRLRKVPGVETIAATDALPMRGFAMSLDVRRPSDQVAVPEVAVSQVSSSYFAALSIGVLEGRAFEAGPATGGPEVVLSATAARLLFPDGKAVGASLTVWDSTVSTVRGVVADVPQLSLETPARPQVYLSLDADPGFPNALVIRTSGEVAGLTRLIQQAVAEVDPKLPVKIAVMSEDVGTTLAPRRFNAILTGTFAGLSLFLAALGLYGALAYQVASRRREFGIRLALGSERHQVLTLVLGHGMRVVGVGVVIGLAMAYAASRALSSLLFEVGPHDPVVFGVAPAVLLLTAVAAGLVPAWRAMRTDPIVALRNE